MSDEPNAEYRPLTCKPVVMTLVMDGRGETDETRMFYAQKMLRHILGGHDGFNFDDIEAIEILRDGEPTEGERIRTACVLAIRWLERPPYTKCLMGEVASQLRSAIGRPKEQE